MGNPFDQFAKQLVRAALETDGSVETEVEVPAGTRRIDLRFMPGPIFARARHELGLLARMTAGPSTLEFFHKTPNREELTTCLIKHGEFLHFLSLREAPSSTPIQWVISSGRPDGAIEGLWLRVMSDWPSGAYEAAPLLWTRLIVLSELPVTRDTLILRLLGAGRVLELAITELKALPVDAPERIFALPILLRSRLEVPTDPTMQTSDDQEFLMTTHDIVETWRQEAIQEGVKQGLERGVARSLIDIYEARFGAMPGDLRAMIEATHDEHILRAWLKLAGTQSAAAIAAAIHDSCAS